MSAPLLATLTPHPPAPPNTQRRPGEPLRPASRASASASAVRARPRGVSLCAPSRQQRICSSTFSHRAHALADRSCRIETPPALLCPPASAPAPQRRYPCAPSWLLANASPAVRCCCTRAWNRFPLCHRLPQRCARRRVRSHLRSTGTPLPVCLILCASPTPAAAAFVWTAGERELSLRSVLHHIVD